jgi:two-component sensor histidine kinase
MGRGNCRSAYGVNPDEVSLTLAVEDVPLGVDAAIAIGLITNELVSNSLKHAFSRGAQPRSGRVDITLRTEGAVAVLEVGDDGVGVGESFDFRNSSTLGLRLVCILTEQIRGKIALRGGNGTRFDIRFEPRGWSR